MSGFSKNFWCTAYNDTRGIEALCTRMQNGKKVCKSIEDYLRSRGKCEEEYSKRLLKCAGEAEAEESSTTLKASWNALVESVSEAAKLRSEKSAAYYQAAQELAQFRSKQKTELDSLAKLMTDSHEKYRRQYELCQSLNSRYIKLCKDLESVRKQVEFTERTSMGQTTRELEKMTSKAERTKQSVEQAESAYQSAVQTLEEARVAFINEFTRAANSFETLERDRVEYLRNLAWVTTNLESKVDVDDDKLQEVVRRKLEACTTQVDLDRFVTERRTGSEPPVPVPFENARTKARIFPGTSASQPTDAAVSTSQVSNGKRTLSTLDAAPSVTGDLNKESVVAVASAASTSAASSTSTARNRVVEPVYSEPLPRDQRYSDGNSDSALDATSNSNPDAVTKEHVSTGRSNNEASGSNVHYDELLNVPVTKYREHVYEEVSVDRL